MMCKPHFDVIHYTHNIFGIDIDTSFVSLYTSPLYQILKGPGFEILQRSQKHPQHVLILTQHVLILTQKTLQCPYPQITCRKLLILAYYGVINASVQNVTLYLS